MIYSSRGVGLDVFRGSFQLLSFFDSVMYTGSVLALCSSFVGLRLKGCSLQGLVSALVHMSKKHAITASQFLQGGVAVDDILGVKLLFLMCLHVLGED